MSYHSRRTFTPETSRKRKERETLYSSTSSKPLVPQTAVRFTNPSATTSFKGAEQQTASSNRLLAGYMAYEFLTNGTLLGQKFDPARAGAEAVPMNSAESKRNRAQSITSSEAEPNGKLKPQSYAEVANLLKSDGAYVPGVVNPTQLAKWIQM